MEYHERRIIGGEMKILTLRGEVCGDPCMEGYEVEAEMDDGTYVHITDCCGYHFTVSKYSVMPDECPDEVEFLEEYEDMDYTGIGYRKARKSKYGKVFALLKKMLDNIDEELE